MSLRLRHLADVNPATPEFDLLDGSQNVTFTPLEAVWADSRLDLGQTRAKAEVAAGYTRFRDGDVIVPKVTPTFQAGRSAIVDGLVGGLGAGSTELHVLRAKSGVDPRFLRYLVMSKPFLTEGVTAFQGVAGLQRVPEDFVRDFPVADICLPEQRRIADFLDSEIAYIDNLSALQCRKLELLDERSSVEIHAALSGSERVETVQRAGLSWFGPVDPSWQVTSLGIVARSYMGTTFPRQYQGNAHGKYPFVKVADFINSGHDRIIEFTENRVTQDVARMLGARVIPAGTIVYARVGAALLLNQRRILRNDSIVDDNVRGLLPIVGNSTYWCRLLEYLDIGAIANPGPVPSVSETQIASIKVPVPSAHEQDTIAGKVDKFAARAHELKGRISRQISLLAERRQALITTAIAGEFDVVTAHS